MHSKFHITSLLVAALLALPLLLAACNDIGNPNDTVNAQERSRLNRGVPGPTELPPGLGDDLPPAQAPQSPAR